MPEEEDAMVSVHAMGGYINSQTLRVNGKVNGKDIHILTDSGSTHCFIDEKVVQVLGCRVEPATPMIVRIANGGRMTSKLFCPNFCWEIQGHYCTHPITITQDGQKIVLKALTERGDLKTLSAYSLSSLLRRGTMFIKGQLYATNKGVIDDGKNPKLVDLLQQFADIFQEPRTLPLERAIDHNMELVPEAIPRKQHPYTYAYGQKTEIEKIVKEMLDSGIIRTSQSSFASPVLLVKKKKMVAGGYVWITVMPFGLCNDPSTFQALMNQQVDYLGHVISVKGVATDPQKVECMRNWPVPTTIKALRRFLGLTGYYRKFIKGYEVLSKPLTSLLKKDAFNWNPDVEAAFEHLKEVVSNAPLLALPDFSQPFIVETDVCGKGIGAVLMQGGRPIAYLSKALAAKNMGLSTYEKEFLALLLAVTNYENGILRRRERICVGSHGGIRKKIIKSLHDSSLGGHSGINGTYQRIKHLFYWPTLREDVNTWMNECEVYQRSKHENNPYPGLLQPLPIPNQAWSYISMDFVEGLPPSEGKDSILERTKVLQLLKENLQQAQQRMKLYADKKRTEREFEVGTSKEISSQEHVGVPQVLIQWSHGSPNQATWEDYKDMAAKFPRFDPWGQGSKKGGRSVALVGKNTILSGKNQMSGTNLSRGIEGTIDFGAKLGDFKGNDAILDGTVKESTLSPRQVTLAMSSSTEAEHHNHSMQRMKELEIGISKSVEDDVVLYGLGLKPIEKGIDDCDVEECFQHLPALGHVEGRMRTS
ncbi:UNVERIFIED_CONTAM: Retrovirus-related Pol polyprotein from transposon.6 [Sesamum radiatum]|uniref:Retrovirus-related Pol polyprotein from transposon.6 n=1 Tax=Sesamum radiatum TaxID=300843 RepID=A0AAW2Q0D1_SESRA